MDDDPTVSAEQPLSDEPMIPSEPAPPIDSRFLFVDVAALRAKQLRRGARVRLGEEAPVCRTRPSASPWRKSAAAWCITTFRLRKPSRQEGEA